MSNPQVGTVYQQIIADVIESSRVDFEEGGVDERVLEELRLGWQQKLSQLQVATFPWDPKPDPAPQISNPPTVPSNAGNFGINAHTPPQQQPLPNGPPRIKPEPGLEENFANPPLNLPNATTAQQRAAQHLQANYGQRAAASIGAIQNAAGGTVSQGPQGNPQVQQQQGASNPQMTQVQAQAQAMHNHQMAQMQNAQRQAAQNQAMQQQSQPGIARQGPGMTPEAYRQMMAQQAREQSQRLQQGQGQNSINGGSQQPGPPQTDGPGDEETEGLGVIQRLDDNGNQTAMGRIEIDGLIRKRIEANGQSMEGGGLMLPLHQASTPTTRHRKTLKKSKGQEGGMDGGDEDDDRDGAKDEDDEDAINSDLDDPDDALGEEEDDDESMGHIMLCMYDKVQRVKNKWKCVMKDGVLTVNGREYVFHKASGEYEW